MSGKLTKIYKVNKKLIIRKILHSVIRQAGTWACFSGARAENLRCNGKS